MATLINLLPLILQILGLALHWYGASEDTIQKFLDLVESAKNDGAISAETKEKIKTQREKILARVKAKQGP